MIVKPIENLSIYDAYSVSYLPASGDQFSALTDGTVILEPQKFENNEVGVKWNIMPRLQFTAAVYELNRTNVPLADPNNPGFFLPSGATRSAASKPASTATSPTTGSPRSATPIPTRGSTSDTSTTIVAGNRVQLVPLNQFSWWNKYQIHPDVGRRARRHLLLGFLCHRPTTPCSLPGFVRVDARIYAKINETWRAQLNVENIFNKGYWASADGNNNISPGQPRTFRLSATANF